MSQSLLFLFFEGIPNRVLKLILPEDIKLILPEDIVVTTTITLPEGIMDHLFGGGLVIMIVKK